MYLEFRDLTVYEEERELININRIRIYYSLSELLSGKIISSLKEIRIVKSSFFFDYDNDKDLIDLFVNSDNVNSDIILPDIKVSGRNLKIKLKKENDIIELTNLYFTLVHKDEDTKINTKGVLSSKISNSESLSGNTKFSVSGSVQDNYEISNALFVFKSIENKFLYSNKISLRASYKSGQLTLQKVEDSRPLDIRLSYSNLEKLLKINFDSENFVLLNYFESKTIDPSILQWLGTSITGSGELQYSIDTHELSYSAIITAKTNNSSIPKQATITSSFEGNKASIMFSKLKIETLDGIIVFNGKVNYDNFLPSGNLYVFYNHPSSKIRANLTIFQNNNNMKIIGQNMTINNIEVFNFETNINIYDKDFDFTTSLSFQNYQGLIEDEIILDGNIQYKPDFFLNLSINTVNTPISSIIGSFPVISNQYLNYLPSLFLNSDLFISTDFNKFSFSGSKIQFISKRRDELFFSAFGNNESIDISNLYAKWGDKSISGSIKTDINKRSVLSNINLIFEEIHYSADIAYYPERGVFLQGTHGLSASLYKSGNISEFNLSLLEFPIPFNDRTTSISLESNGYYNNLNNWKFNIDLLDIYDMPGMISGNSLNFSGQLSDKDANLTSINYSDSISTLYGSGSFVHNLFTSNSLTGNFNLESFSGEEYSGFIDIQDNNIDFVSNFIKAPLHRFNKIPVTGLINGNISLNGLIQNPDMHMTLQLEKGEFNSSPLEVEASVELTEEKFQLTYFRIKYKNQIFQKGYGEFNLTNGDFVMDLDYLGVVQNKNIKSQIQIKGESELLKIRPSINEILQSNFTSYFTFNNNLINSEISEPWEFQISNNNQNISFNGGPRNSLVGVIDNSGNFNITTGNGLPVRGSAKGSFANSMIDMSISELEVDLTFLNLIPYGDYLEFTDGTAYGKLNISGQLSNPLFDGRLHVDNAKGNVFMVPEDIAPFSADIIAKERTLYIGPEIISVNGSSVKIGIDLFINNWIPNTYSLNIKTMDQDSIAIIYDIPSIGLGIDGYVSGEIKIDQDEYGIHVNSDLIAEECIINLGTASSNIESSRYGLFIDMLFTTGRKVQFIWPSNTLPILRATAEQDQTIKLNMDNLNGTYSLKGIINIKYGEIYYFQKSFYLSEGSIVFDENESRFDPFLGFIARIKEVGPEGEIINISLIQDKKPVSQFAPRFESDPPLSDVEIFSILGAGVFAEVGSEQIDLTSALLLTGDLVTQFAIIRNFEKKIKNMFNLDLFSIRTQMIQNLLLDRFVQDNSIDQEVYLDSFGRYLDNTSLYLGKYLGDDIFLQALLQINNQQFIDTDLYATNSLLVESTISLEWQTPLFLLGFSVKPDFVDPVSSIQNTSLELSWGYSY